MELVSSLPRRAVLAASVAAALVLAPLSAAVTASAAHADTAPVPPEPTTTVSADVLPTVQINGIAWAQLVVGNRVYVTGSFSQARPAGAASGTNQTARSNIIAYNLSTGAMLPSWAPALNAAAASGDVWSMPRSASASITAPAASRSSTAKSGVAVTSGPSPAASAASPPTGTSSIPAATTATTQRSPS